jgi:hypothetical protein
MLNKAVRFLKRLRAMGRINISLSRGALGSYTRSIDLTDPRSWEFSAFSQNGEDGIIDVLLSQSKSLNRYFIEIGSSDGIENNTSYLGIVKKYRGIMVEGNKKASKECDLNVAYLCSKDFITCVPMFVNQENIETLKNMSLYKDPDVLSLDIDSIDYYVAKAIMEIGFRPKIFVVEYNSAFGPDQNLTIEYKNDFAVLPEHKELYYGVSLSGWKKMFQMYGYHFVTVDTNGVNAFFVNSHEFDQNFLHNIEGLNFAENGLQSLRLRMDWRGQFNLIKHLKFVEI